MQLTDPDVARKQTAIVPDPPSILTQGDVTDGEVIERGTAQRSRGNLSIPHRFKAIPRLPTTVRVSFLGVVLFLIWWGWWRPDMAPNAGQHQALAAEPGVRQSAPQAEPQAQPPELSQNVVLTPTKEVAPVVTATLDTTALAETATNAIAQSDQVILVEPLPTKVALVLVPTPTPTATPTDAPQVNLAALPQVRIIPAIGIKLPPTRTPVGMPAVPDLPPTPTPDLRPLEPGRLWSAFVPLPASENDHFWVGNPFLPSAPNQVGSPNYQFGSTAGDRYRPHHGLDMANPMGTTVLAAVEGEVVHAGPDDVELIGPYNNFYGNTVVIRLDQRLAVGDGQLDVYLLYGHLSQVSATVGQHVTPPDVVGAVGMTGIAIGPHLHVEMRLGANTYRHSVNPYLWLRPRDNNGAVAVRVLTADGRTWPGARLTLARFEGNQAVWARLIETYLDTENIGPDPAWGENGAMDGAPTRFLRAGWYGQRREHPHRVDGQCWTNDLCGDPYTPVARRRKDAEVNG